MGGNCIGKVFKVTTFGESHGPAIGAVVEGCLPGIELGPGDFVEAMARRRPSGRPSDTPRREQDKVEILSGVFEGRTTGAPITFVISNQDADSRPYELLKELFRPGHGDYTYFKKYHHFDFRGGGRYSARETAARVAAGVIADKILSPVGVSVFSYTLELGGIRAKNFQFETIEKDKLRCPDPDASVEMENRLREVADKGDSVGGVAEIIISGCPSGLGEPVFDKLDADLAKAIFSVGTVKGVEIGAGFDSARMQGSQNNDPITPEGFRTNHAGGILAGISNGDQIVIRAALKPIPSIKIKQDTIDRQGRPATIKLTGRYDICPLPRALPVLEAMVKIVLADHYLRQKSYQEEEPQC